MPVLEALGRLCREPGGCAIIALLQQYAPSWLVQLPALLSAEELEVLQRRTADVTRERMLREFAEALEVITVEYPLVFVLEDLHWSDVSTLDLLSMLARRQERARVLVIGTYRPVEVLTRDHPLKGIKQELQLHGQCEELALEFLREQHVQEYLEVRFGTSPTYPVPLLRGERESFVAESVRKLAHLVHQRTDGNPLFMVNVTNDLIARGVETRHLASLQSFEELGIGVPENLRQLIVQQLARVTPDERNVLEAASVAGADFSAAAVAAAVEQSTEMVETHCEALVRREQFLRAQGTSEWPDGTIAARYGFVHALYQEVLYDQLSASRRVRLHRQIGEREEQGYGERSAIFATVFHQLLREQQAVQDQAEAAIALSSDQGFAFILAYATCFKGWTLAMQGQGEEGITQIRRGMTAWQVTGSEFWKPHILALLAEAYATMGQVKEGLRTLDEALGFANSTGERSYEAELYRLKGELTLQQESKEQRAVRSVGTAHQEERAMQAEAVGNAHPTEQAEACFLKAIEIAQSQQAKSWELRASMSLTRLWQQQALEQGARSVEQGERSKEYAVNSK